MFKLKNGNIFNENNVYFNIYQFSIIYILYNLYIGYNLYIYVFIYIFLNIHVYGLLPCHGLVLSVWLHACYGRALEIDGVRYCVHHHFCVRDTDQRTSAPSSIYEHIVTLRESCQANLPARVSGKTLFVSSTKYINI